MLSCDRIFMKPLLSTQLVLQYNIWLKLTVLAYKVWNEQIISEIDTFISVSHNYIQLEIFNFAITTGKIRQSDGVVTTFFKHTFW